MNSIDILLPFWGDVAYMKLAVRSIQAQTDPDWRLVVVDDCYPDPGVAEWFGALNDPRVEYTRNPSNLGANANYRQALRFARAERVVVMGADDVMLPNYLAEVRRLSAARPDAAVIQPLVHVIDGAGREISPLTDRIKALVKPPGRGVRTLEGETLSASLLTANWTYFPALCWDRAVVSRLGFRAGLDVVQDLALLLDVCAEGGVMVVGDAPAFQYRRHSSSDSAVRALSGTRFAEERSFFVTMSREFGARGWRRTARAARWHLTSRLHAATLVPVAARNRDLAALGHLVRHALGR
jgi:glycosyltransferase involved in cell wall biosynthesis